jgi:MarR family transcriptional regulator, 2-MHQ and catechol-resistance regulon repressor
LNLNILNLKDILKSTQKYGKQADLALSVWVKLARAYMTVGKLTAAHIRIFGLTEPQFGVLECLGHLGPLTLSELSKKRLVSGGNMTCVVDNLEKEGLVERVHSTTDRRTIVVRLTPSGEALFLKTFPDHADFVTGTLSVLSEREQESLALLLKKLGLALSDQQAQDNDKIPQPQPHSQIKG